MSNNKIKELLDLIGSDTDATVNIGPETIAALRAMNSNADAVLNILMALAGAASDLEATYNALGQSGPRPVVSIGQWGRLSTLKALIANAEHPVAAGHYVVTMRSDIEPGDVKIVGPFDTEDLAASYGERWQKAHDDNPCWQALPLPAGFVPTITPPPA